MYLYRILDVCASIGGGGGDIWMEVNYLVLKKKKRDLKTREIFWWKWRILRSGLVKTWKQVYWMEKKHCVEKPFSELSLVLCTIMLCCKRRCFLMEAQTLRMFMRRGNYCNRLTATTRHILWWASLFDLCLVLEMSKASSESHIYVHIDMHECKHVCMCTCEPCRYF